MIKRSPFRYRKTSPQVVSPAVMLYIRSPLWLCNFEDLLQALNIEEYACRNARGAAAVVLRLREAKGKKQCGWTTRRSSTSVEAG